MWLNTKLRTVYLGNIFNSARCIHVCVDPVLRDSRAVEEEREGRDVLAVINFMNYSDDASRKNLQVQLQETVF